MQKYFSYALNLYFEFYMQQRVELEASVHTL